MAQKPTSLQRRAVYYRGTVQGVGFRWFVRDWAQRLALRGWVRNREDGAVEAEAQGSPQALADFARQLRLGPAAARVEKVETTALSPAGGPQSFDIL